MIKNKKGFTLIELIVVVAIIGILVAVLVPSISGQFDNAKETAAKANAKVFYSASQTSVTTILAGWDVKGPVTQAIFAIPSIYYESGEYRVYFGKNTTSSSGDVEPITNSVRRGYVSANETDTTTSATDLQTIKEINKHMRLYLGDNSKLTTDNGGYRFAIKGQDVADPIDVTIAVKTTGKNATGTFAGREYRLEVTGLTKDAKYKVTVGGVSKGEFTATGATETIDLKDAFTPIVPTDVATHTAQVNVVALNPATGIPANKGPVTQDLSFYDGDGSTANPYLICDPESLEMLSLKVNADNANFGTKNYKQIASIDMSPVANFEPIGSGSTGIIFEGTYDGGAKADGTGYEIKNLKINKPTYQGVGLFGHTDGATLKNITIGTGSSIIGGTFVGSIAGTLSHSEILNCKNAATVTATGSFAGGIVGRAANYDTNNYRSKISNSANTGNVEGIKYLGGIAGITIRGDIDTSYNTGTVVGTCAGGIVGQLSGNINRCYNTGEIQGKRSGSITEDYMGGIAGIVYTEGEINNSYNTGIISSPAGSWIGGISGAGSGGSTTPIKNVYNKANVTGTAAVGGVLGTGGRSSATNLRYNQGATITGFQEGDVKPLNVPYAHISEFVNATGADRKYWDNDGRLLNADGTLMAGPNPGGA